MESLGVERSLTPVPIEKGRIANLSVGFVENDPEETYAGLISSTHSRHSNPLTWSTPECWRAWPGSAGLNRCVSPAARKVSEERGEAAVNPPSMAAANSNEGNRH